MQRVGRVAEHTAGGACAETEQQELRPVQREQPRLARAQAAHDRTTVQVAFDEAARAQRDRHAGQHGGEQRGEAEKAARALDGIAHLGARALQAVDPLAAPRRPLPRRRTRHGRASPAGAIW